jgi:hypothetical protein
VDFLKDKSILENEIFKLSVICNVLKFDLDVAEQTLEIINRSGNKSLEALRQCRKMYQKFAEESKNYEIEQVLKGPLAGLNTNYEVKSKSKAHKALTTMLVQSYSRCVELLRKNQERYLLV